MVGGADHLDCLYPTNYVGKPHLLNHSFFPSVAGYYAFLRDLATAASRLAPDHANFLRVTATPPQGELSIASMLLHFSCSFTVK